MPCFKRRLNSSIANKSKATLTFNSTKTSFVGTIIAKKLSFYAQANTAIITPSCVENKLASALQNTVNVPLHQSNLFVIKLRSKQSSQYQNKLSFTFKSNQSFMSTWLTEYPKKDKLLLIGRKISTMIQLCFYTALTLIKPQCATLLKLCIKIPILIIRNVVFLYNSEKNRLRKTNNKLSK